MPLTMVEEQQSGRRVAFAGRMVYRGGTNWLRPHTVRLVWAVQMLVDICAQSTDGVCTRYRTLQSAPDHPELLRRLDADRPARPRGPRRHARHDLRGSGSGRRHQYHRRRAAVAAVAWPRQRLPERARSNGTTRDVTVAKIARRFNHATNSGVSDEQRWVFRTISRSPPGRSPRSTRASRRQS